MSEHHGHEHDHNDANEGHGHIPGPVRSAMGLLADSLDKARNLAGPAGEKARHVSDKVREDLGKVRDDFDKVRDESAGVFDKVRDEGTNVVNKLRGHGHSGPIDASNPNTGAQGANRDEMRDKAMEALDIAKTVGAAILVGTVKAVQLAMREWQAHTGNASTPEDNVPKAAASAAWDTAGTPKAPAYEAPDDEAEPQPTPEVHNWDDVEAEVAGEDVWGQETDPMDPATPSAGHVEVEETLAYTSETGTPGNEGDEGGGVALRAEASPEHSGHATPAHSPGPNDHGSPGHVHTAAPLEGFDEMTIGSLRGRLGSLSLAALEALRDYERSHTARPQVLTMLENRIAKVTAQGPEA
ncbi:MAG: hypothetical protein QOG52_14 [Frankiaceae bacterium]|jgi:hypothetical protein|nr:hypothetical protein [Frankiaceae bacterium]